MGGGGAVWISWVKEVDVLIGYLSNDETPAGKPLQQKPPH